MRHLLALVLMVCMVGVVSAADLGNHYTLPTKGNDHVVQDGVPSDRQGGDTIADAMMIPGLPFSDNGTTCGYMNDYDEICPFSGSTSPDVVYSLYIGEDSALSVDLCGSLYDTKVYAYDEGLGLIACNDDYYYDDICGVYVSAFFDAFVAGGQTIYIVVDGYGGGCGEYLIDVSAVPYIACDIVCPAGGELEGEGPLGPGYVDPYNGGCNSQDYGTPFQNLCGQSDSTHLEFCGVSGWYDNGFRDTDWFIATFEEGGSGVIDWWLDAEYGTYLFELFPQDCVNVAVAQLVQVIGGCAPVTMTVFGAPGDIVWMWVGPDDYYPPPGLPEVTEYEYLLIGDGLEPCFVDAEDATWSDVKGLYR